MRAQAGDWLITEGCDTEHHARRARILSVSHPDGTPPYQVRWDDGHEGFIFPGPDSHVVKENQAPTDSR